MFVSQMFVITYYIRCRIRGTVVYWEQYWAKDNN